MAGRGDFVELHGKGKGRLVALELPAGDYEFVGWYLGIDGGTISPVQRPSIQFTVTAGKVTYIGEMMLTLNTGDNLFGLPVIGAAEISLNDASSRHIPLFKVRYPKLSNQDITYSMAKHRTRSRVSFEATPALLPTTVTK